MDRAWWVGVGAVAALVLTVGALRADPAFAVREKTDIAYRERERGEILPAHRLDLYLPAGVQDFPVIVLVHGGAWVAGDKHFDFLPAVARCLARQGIGVVVPNYRLAPWSRPPAQARDVARALAWTCRHIAEHGGRPDRVFLLGHSAGGHLVSLLVTEEAYLRREGLRRADVRGVIAVSGVYQIAPVQFRLALRGPFAQCQLAVTANPYALVFGHDEADARHGSPLLHVQPGLPPFLVICADNDLPTLAPMARTFATALQENQVEAQFLEVRGRTHCTVLWRARTAEDLVARAVLGFVRRHTSAPGE